MLLLRKYGWEITGWIGAFFALLAFGLNSFEVIDSQSLLYLGMYSLGCLLMAFYGFSKKAPASWVLNIIFLLVAILALLRSYVLES